VVVVTITGPLERMLVAQLGRPLGSMLSPVIVRALIWWVDVPEGLRPGDEIVALFEERANQEPVLHAVRFKSGKAGRVFRAYRYAKEGTYGKLYQPDGQELERRLVDAPLDDYDQVSSLLRDGRGHKGVDFKTAVGTPVKAPFDAVVLRRNWNVGRNGNSLDLRERGGAHRSALFLHLSEIAVAVGASVHKGQVVAKSGNTGHSFAPHLHYQLEAPSGKVLDPFVEHQTTRRALDDAQRKPFEAEMHKLDALVEPALAQP
jgi:murein DD-endopeptidase MepM/ murein hydrolase activator NlpD